MKQTTLININTQMRNVFVVLTIIITISMTSCQKLVEVSSPDNALTGDKVYSSDPTAIATVTGLYAYMSAPTFPFATGINSISIQSGLSSDELTLYTASTDLGLKAQYRNQLTNSLNPPLWTNLYQFLFRVNAAIEGLTGSTTLTASVKKQLLGETYFLRAFCYFYLINLYGDVPLVVGTDYKVNSVLPRTPKADVWKQVIKDLKIAQEFLAADFLGSTLLSSTSERIRPTKWAATGLLSRTYLYTSDFAGAEIEATKILSSPLFDTVSLNGVFLKNSKEAIWQLQPVNAGWNTEDARVFILTSAPNGSRPVYISNVLLNSFENNDRRKSNWIKSLTFSGITYNIPFKYKNSATSGSSATEYLMVLRLGEQFLIRAEARARLNKLAEAQNDLNIIRKRAGLPDTIAVSQTTLLDAIIHERQVELFSEWGHRWLDLKRTGTVDAIMSVVTPQKGGVWNSNWQLYPIPISELNTDVNLIQNPGY